MNTPSYTPAVDPELEAEQQQAANDKITALQQTLQGDTASTMARYGTRVALSGANIGSPLTNTTVSKAVGAV